MCIRDRSPAGTWTVAEYAFLVREPGGAVRAMQQTHRLGLFPRSTWLRLIGAVGFQARAVTEETTEDREPSELFTALRPYGTPIWLQRHSSQGGECLTSGWQSGRA